MWRAPRNFAGRLYTLPPVTRGSTGPLRTCSSKTEKTEAASEGLGTGPPPPPPLPDKKGGFFWKFLGLTLVGGGGVVGYAWYDQNFRKTLEENIPYSDQAFNYMFQYLPPFSAEPQENTDKKPALGQLSIDPEEAKKMSLQKKEAIEAPKVKEAEVKPTKAELEKKRKEEEKQKKEEAKRREEEKKQQAKEAAVRKIREKELEEAAENAALENILQTGLSDAKVAVQMAIDLQKSAAKATRSHTQTLREAMDLQGKDKEHQWEASTAAFATKTDLLAEADSSTEGARLELERVRAAVSEGKSNNITRKNKTMSSTEQTLNSLNYDLKTAIAENSKAQSEARVMQEYRGLVKKGQEQFQKEISSLTPEVSLGKKGKLSEDELNSLIAHAHRRIEQIQRQLAEQQALEKLRIDAALDTQRKEDDKLADAQVAQERERLLADFSVQKDKWDIDARVVFEVELRRQLARQAAAHSDHLAEVLKVQEGELGTKFDEILNDRILEEKENFKTDVAGWIARLKGIEAAVEGRAEMEKQGRKAQELWLACQMLNNILSSGPDYPEDLSEVPEDGQMRKPLLDEFMAILEAGTDHPFVNSVLETIPDDSVKHGVYTEKMLLDRFSGVRRVCRRVAMVDDTGGSLVRYFLSYLQSFFVFTTSKPLADTDKVELGSLSTFVILDNAQYHLQHGNMEQALRFMNQLQGEPLRVASDWIREAKLMLETQQAANALLAHSSANGLGALF